MKKFQLKTGASLLETCRFILVKILVLLLALPVLQSCFNGHFRTVTIADERLDGRTSLNVLRLMLKSGKYVIVHYGNNYVNLKNAEIDSVAGMLKGTATALTQDHLGIQTEIAVQGYRMRDYGRDNISDELNIYITRYQNGGKDGQMLIPLSAIKRMDINQIRSAKNITSGALGALLITGVAITAAVAILCNCPHVKAIKKNGDEFRGSLFPGAIGKTLQRKDRLPMRDIAFTDNGEVKVTVANELPEIEFIDQVELFEVKKMPYSELATEGNDNMVSFNPAATFLMAKTQKGSDITNKLKLNDEQFYDFSEPGKTDELNKVYLSFKNKPSVKKPMLFVSAKQDKWLEMMAEYGFSQMGNKFPLWVKKMNKADPAKFKERTLAKGISMGVYQKIKSGWKLIGSLENIGTLACRMKAIELDADCLNSDSIQIKFESAHAFWDIDFVCISDEWSREVELKQLKLNSARDQNGADVSKALADTDKKYHEMPEKGNFINLLFEKPENENAQLVLSGCGYYNHKRNYKQAPNYKLLKYMRSNNLSYHQVSALLYSQRELVFAH